MLNDFQKNFSEKRRRQHGFDASTVSINRFSFTII